MKTSGAYQSLFTHLTGNKNQVVMVNLVRCNKVLPHIVIASVCKLFYYVYKFDLACFNQCSRKNVCPSLILSPLKQQKDVKVYSLLFTHRAEVEDPGNGFGDEEDFRPVTTDNQQETICSLVDKCVKRGLIHHGGLRWRRAAHPEQELSEFFLGEDGRLVGGVREGAAGSSYNHRNKELQGARARVSKACPRSFVATLPLRAFRCCTAFRRTVSLSSF